MNRDPSSLLAFVDRVLDGLDQTQIPTQRATMTKRVKKRYSLTQCAKFLGVGLQFLSAAAKDPHFPQGRSAGRERSFSVGDLFRMRALLAKNAKRPYDYFHWRGADEPLRVVSFASQKGGTGKSVASAHFAQYLALHFGMRVGLIDADPQATLTLYFAGSDAADLPDQSTPTLVDFMGLYPTDDAPYDDHSPNTLDAMWRPTAWPGARIVPAHASVSEGEIQIARILRRPSGRKFYRFLHDALARWRDAHPPRSRPQDLLDESGAIDEARFHAALRETLDVVVIDYQPALTLFQLNNLVASTDLVVPQTMKGFDLATLNTFLGNLGELVDEIARQDELAFGYGAHLVLPTIVQRANAQDLEQLAQLMAQCGDAISPVHVYRSDALTNAATVYQSCYEYDAPANQRQGIKRFMDNVNAANDAIASRIWPAKERGYARAWIQDHYDDAED